MLLPLSHAAALELSALYDDDDATADDDGDDDDGADDDDTDADDDAVDDVL